MTTADEVVQELAFSIRDGVNGDKVYIGKSTMDKARVKCPGRSEDTDEVATIKVHGRTFVVQLWEVE